MYLKALLKAETKTNYILSITPVSTTTKTQKFSIQASLHQQMGEK